MEFPVEYAVHYIVVRFKNVVLLILFAFIRKQTAIQRFIVRGRPLVAVVVMTGAKEGVR